MTVWNHPKFLAREVSVSLEVARWRDAVEAIEDEHPAIAGLIEMQVLEALGLSLRPPTEDGPDKQSPPKGGA